MYYILCICMCKCICICKCNCNIYIYMDICVMNVIYIYTVFNIYCNIAGLNSLSCSSSPVLVASNLAQFGRIPILLVYLSRKHD